MKGKAMLKSGFVQRCLTVWMLLSAVAVVPAAATVIYSNFGSGGSYDTSNGFITSHSHAIGASFQANTNMQFLNAQLALVSAGGDATVVYLASDNSGQPGSVLDTLIEQSPIGPSGSIITFTCTVCPTLSAGTRYWIVSTFGNGQTLWFFNTTGANGVAVNNDGLSPNGPWNLFSFPTPAFAVEGVNQPPVALAGPEQAVAEASLVTLDGSASYDPDAEPLTYVWSQIEGLSVPLSDPEDAQPTFLAPLVGPAGATLRFQLTVTDASGNSANAITTVQVTNVNHPPVANAGPDQTVKAGTTVQLDGTASRDPDSDPLTFTWSALSGPAVQLSDVHSPTPSFTGPQVMSPTPLTFQLLVEDGLGGTARAEVRITLLPVDAPPLCTQAVASPARLWPPNHQLVDVKITGVTDPDDQQIRLRVTRLMQDEPVGCRARPAGRGDDDDGDGDDDGDDDDDEARGCRQTSPDAVIHADGRVSLRAERREHGNGRVYRLTFQADDGRGGQCTGQVTVCVPRERHGRGCRDDGSVYDATQR